MAANITRVEFLTALVKGLESMGKDVASRLGTNNTLILDIRAAHKTAAGMLADEEDAQPAPVPAAKPAFAGPFQTVNVQSKVADQPKPQPVAAPKCQGTKANGKPCRATVKAGVTHCRHHQPAANKPAPAAQPKQPVAAKSVPTEYAQTKPVGHEDKRMTEVARRNANVLWFASLTVEQQDMLRELAK